MLLKVKYQQVLTVACLSVCPSNGTLAQKHLYQFQETLACGSLRLRAKSLLIFSPLCLTKRSKVRVASFQLVSSVHLKNSVESSRQVHVESWVTSGQGYPLGLQMGIKGCHIKSRSCDISLKSAFHSKQQCTSFVSFHTPHRSGYVVIIVFTTCLKLFFVQFYSLFTQSPLGGNSDLFYHVLDYISIKMATHNDTFSFPKYNSLYIILT